MASLAIAAGAAPSMVNCACSFAGAIAGAPLRSACAVSGAKRASSAITGVMSGASRSTRMLPCGDGAAVTMRPLAEKAAPPRSATESRSICKPFPSTFNLALASRATNPAMVARPISAAIVMSCGRSILEPASSALPKPSAASISSSGALSSASSLAGRLPDAKDISEAAGDGFAVERGLEPVDGDSIAAERDIAAQAQGPQVALRHVAAPFQPRGQHFRIAGLDLGRPGEGDAVAADREMAAQPHLGEARRAKLETIQIPALGVGADVAAQIRNAAAAERDLVDADADLDRDGGAERSPGQFRNLADGGGRRRPAAIVAGERAIEIDLPARQHAVEARAACRI